MQLAKHSSGAAFAGGKALIRKRYRVVHVNCHRFLTVIFLVFGLISVRSFGEVRVVENPAGKLGFTRPASQSAPVSNIGQPSSQAAAIQVAAVSTDSPADDTSVYFSPENWWVVVLVILLVTGVGILFRKMETGP